MEPSYLLIFLLMLQYSVSGCRRDHSHHHRYPEPLKYLSKRDIHEMSPEAKVKDTADMSGSSPAKVKDTADLSGSSPAKVKDTADLSGSSPAKVKDTADLSGSSPAKVNVIYKLSREPSLKPKDNSPTPLLRKDQRLMIKFLKSLQH